MDHSIKAFEEKHLKPFIKELNLLIQKNNNSSVNALIQENQELKKRVEKLEKKSEEVEQWKEKWQALEVQLNHMKASLQPLINGLVAPSPIPADAAGDDEVGQLFQVDESDDVHDWAYYMENF